MARFVRIANLTQGTTVAERCRIASSARDRMIGLLSTPDLPRGEGLLIERSPSIHMFFMRYPIDVVFVDRGNRVTKVVERLRPWRIVPWARGARDCIELRVGAIAASGTRPGDQLALTNLHAADADAANADATVAKDRSPDPLLPAHRDSPGNSMSGRTDGPPFSSDA